MGGHGLAAQQGFESGQRSDHVERIDLLDQRANRRLPLNRIGVTKSFRIRDVSLAMPRFNIGVRLVDDPRIWFERARLGDQL
ncbi:MAG: hypothetical protein EBR34_00110 [Sphingomonadaceae bacterium]|nr:hypothetical protein [Sphingomonadaceae bacterium]